MKINLISVFVIAIGLTVAIFIRISSAPVPKLGLQNGKLTKCQNSPNCVSSQSKESEHAISPIKILNKKEEVMAKLASVIQKMPGAKIITQKGPYIHAEYTSSIFRFIDDLECYYNKTQGVVHIRSASRTGYYDFKVNLKRVNALKKLFNAEQLKK